MDACILGVIDLCVVPLDKHPMPLGFRQKWQERNALIWIGDDILQQGLIVGRNPLNGCRIEQVGVERAYRIVGMLEQTSRMMQQEVVPILLRFVGQWRRKILWLEGLIGGAILVIFMTLTIWGGYR